MNKQEASHGIGSGLPDVLRSPARRSIDSFPALAQYGVSETLQGVACPVRPPRDTSVPVALGRRLAMRPSTVVR
jgi:hypothetical protein